MKQRLSAIQTYAPANRHAPIILLTTRRSSPSATTLIGEHCV